MGTWKFFVCLQKGKNEKNKVMQCKNANAMRKNWHCIAR
jgi:hypothetical protein